jgi:hypothetical protein
MIGRLLQCVIVACAVLVVTSCRREETAPAQPVNRNPAVAPYKSPVTWSTSEFENRMSDDKELKRAWKKFEQSQKYRLAQPSDRNLTPEAAVRVRTNSEGQIVPFLSWWGAEGYQGKQDFIVAILVDPSRTDPNRYGLVVIAAPTSDGGKWKVYWVAREEDMESYLISPASGSVFIECFHRDGTEETKSIAWYRSKRQFQFKKW